MSDLARHLPLSLKRRRNESRVTRDRTELARAALRALAAMLREAPPAQWEQQDAATPGPAALASALLGPAAASATDAADAAEHLADTGTPALRTDAALAEIVVAALRIERALHAPAAAHEHGIGPGISTSTSTSDAAAAVPALVLDPLATGAVALHLAMTARYPVKAVVTTQTLAAVDADWRVGRGPTVWGTASEIVLFLAGVAPVPHRPAPPSEEDDDA